MPRHYKRRKYARRRPYRRKRRATRLSFKRKRSKATRFRRVRHYKPAISFGIDQNTKIRRSMRYHDRASIDPAAGSFATDTWSLNGVFDPYTGLGGHQPYGFDQIMADWNLCLVKRCSFRWTFLHANIITSTARAYLYWWHDDGINQKTAPTTTTEVVEFPWVHYKVCSPGEAKPCYLTGAVDAKNMFGANQEFSVAVLGTNMYNTSSANPQRWARVHVGLMAIAGGDIPVGDLVIDLTYDCEFLRPHDKGLS